MANYDILGNIAIVKFPKETSAHNKLQFAKTFIKEHNNVKTVLEKTEKVSGRLRTIKTRHLAGEKNLIAEYSENGCKFRFNVETCYFSPRLSNERLEVAKIISKLKKPKVLVMFSGVAPFTIVIAKNSKPSKIASIELGKECSKYALANLRLNKIYSGVEILQGDVKRIIKKLKGKYDSIVMPRPNLKDTFLKEALSVAKKGAVIIYYGFCAEDKLQHMLAEIPKEAKKCKKKIKITNVKEAGDIAPYEHRYRIEMKVL